MNDVEHAEKPMGGYYENSSYTTTSSPYEDGYYTSQEYGAKDTNWQYAADTSASRPNATKTSKRMATPDPYVDQSSPTNKPPDKIETIPNERKIIVSCGDIVIVKDLRFICINKYKNISIINISEWCLGIGLYTQQEKAKTKGRQRRCATKQSGRVTGKY